MRFAAQFMMWFVAVGWWSRVIPALLFLKRVPDLNLLTATELTEPLPSLAVVVPAKNEAAAIERTLRSLAQQRHQRLDIIAVNDRSTDATGAIMDRVASEFPDRIRVLHIVDLPAEWTGKVHAMANGARLTESEWILFTDGDVYFHEEALARTVVMAERARADHFVTIPTMEVRSFGEGIILGFFQNFSIFVTRLWKVPDPKAKLDAVGIGAFNMIRRSAYDSIGGFDAMPMEICEDMRLAREVKRAGLRSQVAFGRGLVGIHWAQGISGLMNTLTKNTFAGMGFHLPVLLAGVSGLILFTLVPFAGVFVSAVRLPAVATVLAMFCTYVLYAPKSGLRVSTILGAPVAAAVLIFTLLRSGWVTLRDHGVTWRGTFYPLDALRRNAGPLL